MSKLLRMPELVKHTGLPRSTIYAMIRNCQFPRPIKLSERARAWRLDEIEAFIDERTRASRAEPAIV